MISWPDVTNGGLEIISVWLIAINIRAVLRDKAIAGVTLVSQVAYSVWSLWNCYYYLHLSQVVSGIFAVFVLVANVIYAALMVKYRGNHG